ncbi:RNA polymerase sigma factor [Fimbriiglobus ruber]|uniref:RNA polymerase sigma factor n=1 Tax=Fimbriiglobus ruber TaxID=1908690 RepID=UPI00137A2686|nr:sigma-70 family RNA polymerase sigma factor [Fimbriiglobus ruber]
MPPTDHDPLNDSPGRVSFADVVREHWVTVFRCVYHMTGNTHDAEELTQETFLRAMNSWPKFEAGPNPRAWVLRIARNAYTDLYRRKQKVRFVSLPEHPTFAAADATHAAELADESALVRAVLGN